jgi:ATP-dependent Clp endopeptidase proteolytic subunit ClpP
MFLQVDQPINVIYDVDPYLHLKPEEVLDIPKSVYVNTFDEESVRIFIEDMTKAQSTSQPIIPIYIDSYGGDVYALMAMIDIVKLSDKPVATICMGKAMSCGAVLLACGTKGHRYISPNATVMIHDVSSFSEGKSEEIKSDAAETERLQKMFYKILDKECERKDGYFDKLVFNKGRSNLYLDAEQCLKHVLADEIKIPKFIVEIVHNIVFE